MRNNKGLTLVELLVVSGVSSVLLALAVPNFLNAQVRQKVSQAHSDQRILVSAVEAFNIDNGQYPPLNYFDRAISRQCRGRTDISCARVESRRPYKKVHLTTPIAYIPTLPFDPFRAEGASEDYQYGSDGFSYYVITSYGPDGVSGFSHEGGSVSFDEGWYSGAQYFDTRESALGRISKLPMMRFLYHPTNGLTSGGDIIKLRTVRDAALAE